MNATIKGYMNTKLTWTKEIDKIFEKMKKEVATQPTLVFPSFEKPFVLECDASNIVVGVVLSQEGRLVEFFRKRLNEPKTRYSSYDLELYVTFPSP